MRRESRRFISAAVSLMTCALFAFLGSAARAIERINEIYVVNTDPPSLAVIDSQNWKLLGSIPLEKSPSHALIDPQNQFLYVLHYGVMNPSDLYPTEPSKVTVIDVTSRQVVRTIPVGWNVFKMSFVKDGQYLLCFSIGNEGSKKIQREPGAVTIIDTNKRDAIATLSAGRLGSSILFTKDASRIFVLSRGDAPKKKDPTPPAKPALTVFSLDSEHPLAEIELAQPVGQMVFSRDEKWLYLLDKGFPSKKAAKHRNGIVHVVDTSSLQLVKSYDVGTSPRSLDVDPSSDAVAVLAQASFKDESGKLYLLQGSEVGQPLEVGRDPKFLKRSSEPGGRFVVAYDEFRFLSNDGALASSFVPLNKKKGNPPAGGPDVPTLGGYAGEVLQLPGSEKVAMTVTTAYGAPTSKVAIVNLKENKVEKIVTTGRGGVKFGQFMGAMALSVAMTSLSYYGNYYAARSMGQPYFFYDVYMFRTPSPNLDLAASADGKFIYALNSQTNDVTIIDSGDGKVLGHVAVGGGARRVLLSPGGKYICAYSNKEITLIDTQSNQQQVEHKLLSGRMNALQADETGKTLLALTSKALEVWDSDQGKLLATVDGLAEPQFVVRPNPIAAK